MSLVVYLFIYFGYHIVVLYYKEERERRNSFSLSNLSFSLWVSSEMASAAPSRQFPNNPPKRGQISARIRDDLATSAAAAATYVTAALAGFIPDRTPPELALPPPPPPPAAGT